MHILHLVQKAILMGIKSFKYHFRKRCHYSKRKFPFLHCNFNKIKTNDIETCTDHLQDKIRRPHYKTNMLTYDTPNLFRTRATSNNNKKTKIKKNKNNPI